MSRSPQRHGYAAASLLTLLLAAGCSPAPRWVAVALPRDHAILLFDAALHPTGRLTVEGAPTALESTGDGMSLLVGAAGEGDSGRLTWVGRTDGARVLDRELPGPVRDLRLHNDGNTLFVLSAGHPGGVSVRGTTALTQERWISVCDAPRALAFTREGDQGYVTCAPGAVAEVDPTLEYLVQRAYIAADSGRACGAGHSALSPNNTFLYIPCAVTGRLLYVDRVTLKPWDSTEVGVGITAVAAAPGAVAVVLQPDSDHVVLVDLARRARLATISTPPRSHQRGAERRWPARLRQLRRAGREPRRPARAGRAHRRAAGARRAPPRRGGRVRLARPARVPHALGAGDRRGAAVAVTTPLTRTVIAAAALRPPLQPAQPRRRQRLRRHATPQYQLRVRGTEAQTVGQDANDRARGRQAHAVTDRTRPPQEHRVRHPLKHCS